MRLFWLGLAWLTGLAAARAAHLVTWQWLVLAACCLAAILLFRRTHTYRDLFLTLLIFTLGAARAGAAQNPLDPGHVAHYNDQDCRISLTGVVVASPDVRDTYTGLRLQVESLESSCAPTRQTVHGLVLLRASRFETWSYGDRVLAAGYVETPPVFETFSYRDYLARQGIHSIMSLAEVTRLARRQANPLLQVIFDYRAHALEAVHALFPDPEASLLAGILLGIESGISPQVRQTFNNTSTTHIIAISGFNITIIASLFISLFGRWLGARRGAIAAGLAIVVYTVLVGADAAVVRAAVMGGLALLARYLGRQTHGLASLAGAALVMTAINPTILWDVGFQLSFAATLGLILYADPVKNWFIGHACRWMPEERAERLADPVSEYLLFTLAAQLTTLPLTAYYFQRFSLVSFLANPVILPLQPAVMVLGGLAMLAGTVLLPLGRVLAWIAWPFAALTIRAVAFFASWPVAALPLGRVSLLVVAGFYAVLFGLTAMSRLPPERRQKFALLDTIRERINLQAGISLLALAVLAALTWRAAVDRPDGKIHIHVLDVGDGDAVLIQSPTGRFVLIDGGPSPVALSDALGRRLPLLDPRLDWLVIGGAHDEQVAGLTGAIERFPVGEVLVSGGSGGYTYRRLMDDLTERGIPITEAQAGHVLDLGEGARLEVTAMGEHGVVFMLSFGSAHFLLAPGADPQIISELADVPTVAKVNAVLLPDSGYAAVNPPAWLGQLQPRVALISVGAGEGRGLPSPDVLDALGGSTILRTDIHGWIHLMSDGQRMWVEVERKTPE
jgi:competence protein ComEC